MTEPSKTTQARTNAREAKAKAQEAAEQAATAASQATESITTRVRTTVQNGYAAVRNDADVQKVISGTRGFLKKAEDPALIVATAVNPLIGLGATGIVKGSRLLAEGIRRESASTVSTTVTK